MVLINDSAHLEIQSPQSGFRRRTGRVSSVTGAERVRLAIILQGEHLAGRALPNDENSLFGRGY
jgi:hypothetical protein